MDPKNHPTVRRGTRWWRCQSWTLAILLTFFAILLLRDPMDWSILGAVACTAGAGLSIYLGEKMVKGLRHAYRYKIEGIP